MSTNEIEVIFTCACAGDLGARVGGYTAALLFEQPDGSFNIHDVYEGGPHRTYSSLSSALDEMVAIAQNTYAVMQKRLAASSVMDAQYAELSRK
jgi:hypothetical protein